jgi:hypothetical protein
MAGEPDLQKLADVMSLAVANANTSWARVENAMAGLLEWLLGYSSDNVALHVYFAPSNTETRFKIVDAAAQVKWKGHTAHNLLAEWTPIFQALGRAKEARNRIAHGEVKIASQTRRGSKTYQARLTVLSFDIARKRKEAKPRQWPGMSLRDVKATADRFFWLAVQIEEMREYWKAYSIGPQSSLPEIFARIVERRQNSGPLSADLKPPKPKRQPQSSKPSSSRRGPRLSAKQRRVQALARAGKT